MIENSNYCYLYIFYYDLNEFDEILIYCFCYLFEIFDCLMYIYVLFLFD